MRRELTGDSPTGQPSDLATGMTGVNKSIKPTFVEGPCIKKLLQLLKKSGVPKVGNL
jgi:hypothetical protein